MGDSIQFFGWERSGAAEGGVPDGGRLKGFLTLKLTGFAADGSTIETIQARRSRSICSDRATLSACVRAR